MKKTYMIFRSLLIAITAMTFQVNILYGQVATLKNWSGVYHGASSSQQNITYSVPTGSNSKRVLVVAIASVRTPAGQLTVDLTYGGQTLTSANGDIGTSIMQHTSLYYLNEAGLDAAGNTTLSVTVSGGTIRITDVWAAVFDYVNQTTPITNSQNYNSGLSSVMNFSFGTALGINSYNRAVEVVCSHVTASQPCSITYATEWTMVRDSTSSYSVGMSAYYMRNGVANRSIPSSNITDPSSTTFSVAGRASMTGLSLNYEAPPPPTVPASNVTFSNVTSSSMTISWTSGNGTNRLVLMKAGSAVDSDPVNGTSYIASNLFGSGSQIGTANYVVYDGTGNSVTVSNLTANTTYHVAVFEFSIITGLNTYLTTNPARGSQLTGSETAGSSDYRSNGSGNWSNAAIWETYNGSSWVTASTAPSSSSGIITVRAGHTISVADAVTADQVVVETGGHVTVNPGITMTIADGSDAVDFRVDGTLNNSGTLTTTGTLAFSSGSTYNHTGNGGTIPVATWNAGSLCLVTGITSSAPTGFGQSFGNFTWNCGSQTVTSPLNSNVTVQGNFTLTNTGSGKLAITDGTASNSLTISGNYSQSGGTLDFNAGSSSSAVGSLNVAGNLSFTGGSMTESSNGSGSVTFNGSGAMQTYASGGTLSNTINFTVPAGAYLQMGTGSSPAIISGSSGTFTLASGATLGITDHYGITKSATGPTGGNIKVSGNRDFNSGANYIYNGSASQIMGNGLPSTVNSLVINNAGGQVSFSGATTITNALSITTGSKADLGSQTHTTAVLTLGGVGQTAGSYGHSTSPAQYKNDTYFYAATGIVNVAPPAGTWLGITTDWNTDSNWSGGVPTSTTNASVSPYTTNQPIVSGATPAVCNNLTIGAGASLTINPLARATVTATLTNNGTINLKSDDTGMFSLMMGAYAGSGTVNSEIYITGGEAGGTGSGLYRWHYLAVPSQLSKTVLTNINENLMRYDDAASLTDKSQGWNWHDGSDGTIPFNTLLVSDGYSFYHSSNTVVTLTGNSLLASLPVKNLNYYTFGWNLIGNSLTCGINWDNVTFSGNVDHTVYFMKDYVEYYYITGGPSLPYGSYDGHIPPLQGFFVVATGTGASINFSGAKEHNSTPYYKGSFGNNESKKSFPVVRLTLGDGKFNDETVVWFNDEATLRFDKNYDGEKWISEDSRLQFYSVLFNKEYAINAMPFPEKSFDIPLAFRAPENGTYSINRTLIEGLEDYTVYLKDLSENRTVKLNDIPRYSFSTSEGIIKDRFLLSVEKIGTKIDNTTVTEKQFNIYPSFGLLNIELLSNEWEGRKGSVKVYDLTGRTLVDSRNVSFSRSSQINLPVDGQKGLFIIEIESAPLRYTGRVAVK